MQQYIDLKNHHQVSFNQLKKLFSRLAVLRFLIVVLTLYVFWQYLMQQHAGLLLGAIILLGGFMALLRFHLKIKYKRNIQKELTQLNADELNYLNEGKLTFNDGNEYIDSHHLYTFDLDIFGPKSLFHHINRTATPIGRKTLAKKLSTPIATKDIQAHQTAIRELSKKISFRQLFTATAKLAKLDEQGYSQLIEWSKSPVLEPNILVRVLRYLIPLLFLTMVTLAFYTGNILFTYLSNTCFLLNLIVFALQLKKIKNELIAAEKIHETIQQYALILELINKEPMESPYLVELKKSLTLEGQFAHLHIKKLSRLFNNLSSMQNPVGALIFNGSLLYHIGVYQNLLVWKKEHAKHLEFYLNVLGEFEALNAMANFSFNNPEFVFPDINAAQEIKMEHCGHPLIKADKRVCNEVSFFKGNFVILTGSNMSGKSTFLRTLGINMVLTNAGAPVCASSANIHPLPVIVSMRMSDSLTDSESYFFAEVKRLKQIMVALDDHTCFVLLDEILKGTNSDDKRLGTVKVVEKMVEKKAIGAIATHDLEVCNITATYPQQLNNYCFEVEIINNELVFDYKLREGICKNKSATFLMRKMEII